MGPVSKAVHGQNVALNTFTELLFRRCKEEIFICAVQDYQKVTMRKVL